MAKLRNMSREIARDLVALGSIPFFAIVVVRAVIGSYKLFVYELIVAAVFLALLSLVIKKPNHHLARGFVLFVFTSLYYKDALFTTFAFLLWLSTLVSLFYLKEKAFLIAKGIALGIVCSAASYYLSPIIMSALNL